MTAKATKPALAFFEPTCSENCKPFRTGEVGFFVCIRRVFDLLFGWGLHCENGAGQSLDLIDRLPGRRINTG